MFLSYSENINKERHTLVSGSEIRFMGGGFPFPINNDLIQKVEICQLCFNKAGKGHSWLADK